MKIAYLAGYAEGSQDNSVTRKLDGQIAQWRSYGHDVNLVQLSPSALKAQTRLVRQVNYYLAYLRRAVEVKKQVLAIEPELIYSRYFQYSPHLVQLVRKFPSVLEANSDDLTEYRSSSWAVRLVNGLMRKQVYQSFDGLVVVTSELGRRLCGERQRCMCIGNGIPDEEIVGSPVPGNDRPVIGFIGSGDVRWHGLDELRLFASRHPEFEFRVIGQSTEWNLPNVWHLGMLSHTAAGLELAKCDVAVSSLGLFRLRMEEACPLKSRQYLAMGLPIVVGYTDPDLRDDLPFVFQVPNRPGGILEVDHQVVDFIWNAKGNEAWRHLAANFAKDVLGNYRKERTRLEFLEAIGATAVA